MTDNQKIGFFAEKNVLRSSEHTQGLHFQMLSMV